MSRKESFQKYDSDRSGFTYQKSELVRQRGLLIAEDEVDDLRKIRDINPRWDNPRENSDSTAAVNEAIVYTISAATGVNTVSNSFASPQDGARQHFFMYVKSDGGAVVISANPKIAVSTNGYRLTLVGTSNTNTVQIDNGDGVSLFRGESLVLKQGTKISLVFNYDTTEWVEVSRDTEGVCYGSF